ncbi:MAG: sigma-70 family RNA polymerase sigma factor [Chitinophaga sp.]|uniref:RNA polymerase sigma factor n=1 Tax=Chitinophaga sp. TaxID=1869181 RepID=UPI0025BA073E|nr:sigma-70 family RNA polymerase sigma factor [Chitinophaga sp.]MBV8252067.1 sigma-70 family RNA polymerase sigma factor [Chitinophaga sp.]
MATVQNEKELLKGLASGDESAFREIYFLYSHRLYGNLLKLVKSETIAQEILQEVFIKIWEHRAGIDIEKSFRSYLFRIAENMVCNFYTKAGRHQALLKKLANHQDGAYAHIEEAIVSREESVFLVRALAALPVQRRQVFELCKMEGKSYNEVSLLLGISVSTISDHIVKANRFLREYALKHKELLIILALVLPLAR